MRKIILDLNEIDPHDFDPADKEKNLRKAALAYISEAFGFSDYFGMNLDALYDELTSITEPTAIGLFMPAGELEDLDIDYMVWLDRLRDVFNEAEADNPEIAVIHGDVVENYGVDAGEDVDALLEELLNAGEYSGDSE